MYQQALKYLQDMRPKLTMQVAQQRAKLASSIRLDLHKAVPAELAQEIAGHSAKCGTQPEMLLVPLLSLVMGMTTPATELYIKEGWTEPAILWGLVAAGKGQKKSVVHKLLRNALEHVDEYVCRQDMDDGPIRYIYLADPPANPFADLHPTLDKVFNEMYKNMGSLTLLCKQITDLYEEVETTDGGRRKLLGLIDGREYTNDTDCRTIYDHTHFNYTRFIHPSIVTVLFNQFDVDGFNEHHWACLCVRRDEATYESLLSGGSDMDLGNFLLVIYRYFHKSGADSSFKLSTEADKVFGRFYDDITIRKEQVGFNEDHYGVLGEAHGQCARVALALHLATWAQKNHCCHPDAQPGHLSMEISADTMKYAIHLMLHAIQHKFALMPDLS